MRKNKEDCMSIAQNITELLNGIKEIIGRDSKGNELLMKNIEKLERYEPFYIMNGKYESSLL
jgi:hypothetical protein